MFLTLLLVSTAVATPLLGTEQCARGPPYWCKNVKTASQCGAVAHCQQNVWNKPQMKSVPCDLCKEVLTVVDQLLKDNSTESEILGYLEKACQLIPDEGLSSECKEMVDSYYPILMGIITGELDDPSIVCGAMGLCESQQKVLAEGQLLSNEIPQVDLAQSVSPFLLNVPQLLYPQETPKVESPKKETPKQENGDVCKDCVQFLTDAQEEAKSNASFINALISQIENQCDLLGPGLSDMCKQYVSQYAPVVIQQLMSMKAEDICARAGFCQSLPHSVPMEKLVAAKVFPAAKLFPAEMKEKPVEMKPVALKPAKKMVRARESPQCAICEFVMKEVESMLQEEKTEENVVHAVEKVCKVLPSTLSAQCKDLIEAYGQAIIELLVQEADPATICTLLGLCKDASRTYIPVMDKARFEEGGFCDVCKMAVRYIDGILEQNATEEEIEDAVRKVCNFLPEAVRTECDQLIQQYEPLLVQLLLQMLDPDFVCMKVGACPGGLVKLLGTEQCSWGPGFWCKNMETATRCNAVDHCRRHVWN
ncbi:prosaposin isoform X2 [Megalops cyprinoides]|uniref:prosaposin isoform X2 n=1 Tax=Megalops cyprinoides TaxID=118141 RepID=UPI0018652DE4|nr:prosaposin isoform X2 [Megalops cyprinoides]